MSAPVCSTGLALIGCLKGSESRQLETKSGCSRGKGPDQELAPVALGQHTASVSMFARHYTVIPDRPTALLWAIQVLAQLVCRVEPDASAAAGISDQLVGNVASR